MKRFISLISALLLVFLNITGSLKAQTEILSIETFGGSGEDGPPRFTRTPDGGFLLSIFARSDGGSLDRSCGISDRIVYRKYDANGVFTNNWCTQSNYFRYISFTHLLPSGNAFYLSLVDENMIVGPQKMLFERETTTGVPLMKKYLNPNAGLCTPSDMMPTEGGNFLVAAMVQPQPGGDVIYTPADTAKRLRDLWLLKVDTNANIIWQKIIGGRNNDLWTKLAIGPDKGYYVAINTYSRDLDCKTCTGSDKFLEINILRLDSVGNILWSRCMGAGEGHVDLYGIIDDGLGGAYIGAIARGPGKDLAGTHIGKNDFWVMHLDKDNNLLLNTCFGTDVGLENLLDISFAEDRTIWLVGSTHNLGQLQGHGKIGMLDTSYGQTDSWILNIDSTGKLLYSAVLGTTGYDAAHSVIAIPDSTVFVGGLYGPPENGGNMPTNNFEGARWDPYMARFGVRKANNIKHELLLDNDVTIYPNPAGNTLYIKRTEAPAYEVIIRNMTGNVMYTGRVNTPEHMVNLTGWAQGVYIVQTEDAEGRQYFKKFTRL